MYKKNIVLALSLLLLSTSPAKIHASATEIVSVAQSVTTVNTTIQKTRKVKNVLCLDGGGIRGWWQVKVLLALQAELSKMAQKPVKLFNYVDVLAGTSIGAIVGSAIAHDSLDLDSMLKILEDEGSKIFSNTLSKRLASLFGATDEIYDKTYLVKRLGEIHGVTTRFTDLKKDLIVVSHNSTRQKTEFCSTLEAKAGGNNKKVAKAVCASASAPVYFQAEQDEDTKDMLIDGGLDANNPTMAAFSVLAKYDGPVALTYNYISVGTGRPNTKRKFDADLGAVDYVPQLMDLCMDGNSQCTSQIAKNIFGKRSVRLNMILPEKVEMDKTDAKNFKMLSDAFDAFMKQERTQTHIKRAAQLLYDGTKEE